MKKLYRKGTVHPTPPVVPDHLLSFLPAVILTLTVALSPEEKEVLAYLVSCSSANFPHNHQKSSQKTTSADARSVGDHSPCFNCSCFRCYMSYWVKWDSSPNRELIHDIIDAFEDSFTKRSKKEKNKKQRRKSKSVKENISLALNEPNSSGPSLTEQDLSFSASNSAAEVSGGETDDLGVEESEKGSVRRLVSFLGERIWSVWG